MPSLIPRPFLYGRGKRGEGRKDLVNNPTPKRIHGISLMLCGFVQFTEVSQIRYHHPNFAINHVNKVAYIFRYPADLGLQTWNAKSTMLEVYV